MLDSLLLAGVRGSWRLGNAVVNKVRQIGETIKEEREKEEKRRFEESRKPMRDNLAMAEAMDPGEGDLERIRQQMMATSRAFLAHENMSEETANHYVTEFDRLQKELEWVLRDIECTAS